MQDICTPSEAFKGLIMDDLQFLLRVQFCAYIYIYIYIELISLFPPLIIFPLNLQILDKNCLGPLRKAYCSSLNLLLRREVRDYNLFTHCIGIIFFISWSFGGKILVITLAFYELRSGHYS